MKRIEQAELAIERIAIAGELLTSLMEDMHHRITELETEVALLSDETTENNEISSNTMIAIRIVELQKDVTFLKELTTQFAGNYHPLATKFREDTGKSIDALSHLINSLKEDSNGRITDLQEQVASLRKLTKERIVTSQSKIIYGTEASAQLFSAIIALEKENMELRDRFNRLEERFEYHIKQVGQVDE